MVIKVAYRVVTGKGAEDERSDEDDEQVLPSMFLSNGLTVS
jgi:hypothetical protein